MSCCWQRGLKALGGPRRFRWGPLEGDTNHGGTAWRDDASRRYDTIVLEFQLAGPQGPDPSETTRQNPSSQVVERRPGHRGIARDRAEAEFLDPAVIARLAHLDVSARRWSRLHRRMHAVRSTARVEFAEHRPYVPAIRSRT